MGKMFAGDLGSGEAMAGCSSASRPLTLGCEELRGVRLAVWAPPGEHALRWWGQKEL